MRVLIAYYSETGNTEKIARAIHEDVFKKHEAHLKKVEEVEVGSLNDYDLVFLGSACHSSDLARPAKQLLDAMNTSPRFKLAGFFTHSCFPRSRGEAYHESFDRWASKCVNSFERTSKEKKIDFKGCFNCQGAPSPPIQEFIHREVMATPEAWEEYIKEALNHPNLEDLQKAKEFAGNTLSKCM